MISSNLPVSFKEQIEVTSASLDQINNSLFYSGQCSSTLFSMITSLSLLHKNSSCKSAPYDDRSWVALLGWVLGRH